MVEKPPGWKSQSSQTGPRLTLFKVGPHGPQLTLSTDIADHDEQRMFSQVPACHRRRWGPGLAQWLGGILRQR